MQDSTRKKSTIVNYPYICKLSSARLSWPKVAKTNLCLQHRNRSRKRAALNLFFQGECKSSTILYITHVFIHTHSGICYYLLFKWCLALVTTGGLCHIYVCGVQLQIATKNVILSMCHWCELCISTRILKKINRKCNCMGVGWEERQLAILFFCTSNPGFRSHVAKSFSLPVSHTDWSPFLVGKGRVEN